MLLFKTVLKLIYVAHLRRIVNSATPYFLIFSYGFAKFLTFAASNINGSFTFYAKQKVSSNKSNAGDLRLSTGGS